MYNCQNALKRIGVTVDKRLTHARTHALIFIRIERMQQIKHRAQPCGIHRRHEQSERRDRHALACGGSLARFVFARARAHVNCDSVRWPHQYYCHLEPVHSAHSAVLDDVGVCKSRWSTSQVKRERETRMCTTCGAAQVYAHSHPFLVYTQDNTTQMTFRARSRSTG